MPYKDKEKKRKRQRKLYKDDYRVRYWNYKNNCKRNQRDFMLNSQQFEQLVLGQCHYCGIKKQDELNGIDRQYSGLYSYKLCKCM